MPFDLEDEDQNKPLDPLVQEYLLSKQQGTAPEPLAHKYQQIVSDDSAVKSAREEADRVQFGTTVAQGLGQMFGGGKHMDNSVFDGLRKGAQDKAKEAQASQDRKASNLVTADKLERQDVERQQADTKFDMEKTNFDWKEKERVESADPASETSRIAQGIAKKAIPGQDFSNMPAEKIYQALKFVQAQTQAELQRRRVEQGDDRLGLGRENLETRKVREGRMERQHGFKVEQKFQDDARNVLKDMRQTDTWKTAEKTLSEIPTMENLLDDAYQKGGQSLAMLGPKVAKGIAGEVGVLTEQDVTRYVKNPQLVQGLLDTVKKLKEGKVSEASYENLKRLMEISRKEAQEKMNRAIDRESELFSRREGIPYEDARFYIDAEFKKPSAKSTSSDPRRESMIEKAMEKYPGRTREQVIKALEKTGAL
jgi:hypothetical protein